MRFEFTSERAGQCLSVPKAPVVLGEEVIDVSARHNAKKADQRHIKVSHLSGALLNKPTYWGKISLAHVVRSWQ